MSDKKAYTERKKILLASLIRDTESIIEDKRTDAATSENKQAAWEEIQKKYNAQPDVQTKRSGHQLRKLWSNLKQRKRKETTLRKNQMLKTGGGTPEPPEEDPVMVLVNEAAPYVDVELNCEFDSTSVFQTRKEVSVHELISPFSEQQSPPFAKPSPPLGQLNVSFSNGEPGPSKTTSAIIRKNEAQRLPRGKKRKIASGVRCCICNCAEEIRAITLKKIQESITQQAELHAQKMAQEESL